MAELEALRKKATQTTPKPMKKEISPLDALLHPKKREVHKSLTLAVAPGVLPKTTSLRVAVSFENENGVVQMQEHLATLFMAQSSVAREWSLVRKNRAKEERAQADEPLKTGGNAEASVQIFNIKGHVKGNSRAGSIRDNIETVFMGP